MSFYETTPRSDLPPLPNFIQLSNRVWRVMGLNPGKLTLQGTNTYLVGNGKRKVLIDCGVGEPGYVPLLIKSLHSIDTEAYISDIFVSHHHYDHWGGLPDILASELNAPTTSQNINIHKYSLPEDASNEHFQKLPQYTVFSNLEDGQIIKIDEDTHLRIVHTPGHSEDHCCFYLEEEGAIFTADCIVGHGSTLIEDLTLYMHSLQKVKDLQPVHLFPGHGEIIRNSIEKIDQYMESRLEKERQILDILLRDTSAIWTSFELADVLTEGAIKQCSQQIQFLAVRNVVLHLIKLYFDGKVELVEEEKLKDSAPYDAQNAINIMDEKWRYIGESVTKVNSKL